MIALALEERSRLPLAAVARMLGVSRADFYRSARIDHDVELRDAVHAIALDWPRYGYRTISRELRRRGMVANEKRVRRVLREEGLLCRRRKRRGLPYRQHGLIAFPNLAAGCAATRVNELWVADFTYIHFCGGYIFVAII